jgi:hypothetical protein
METITVLNHAVSKLAIASVLALGLSGCGNQTVGFPTVTNSYVFVQTIAIPNVPASGWSEAYSSIDAADGYYLLTDRTNAAVDVINMSTMSFARFAGTGSFAGNRTSPASSAGPNDVVPIGGGNAAASDGNSDVVFVNLNTGATLATVTVPNTGSTKNRVDLIGFDGDDNILMGANDAAKPWPVVSFISTVAPYPVLGTVSLTGATGAEKPTYDPIQKKFLIGIPSTPANPGGEIDVFDPKTRAIVKVYPLNSCGPAGTTMGPGEQLAVSCATLPTPSQIIDATNGTVLGSVPDAAGCDQVWYNPGDNRYSFACSHTTPPNVTIVDAATFKEITTIVTVSSANGVSVDPATNRIYIPERSGKTGIGLDVYAYL